LFFIAAGIRLSWSSKASQGENVVTLPIGKCVDPTIYDPVRRRVFALYSAAMWAPFSATERFISSTRKASATDTTAKIRKQSK
jgi:hypothetical protein